MGDNGVYISTYEKKGTKHPPFLFVLIVLYLKPSFFQDEESNGIPLEYEK